jgi:hypothetical protein
MIEVIVYTGEQTSPILYLVTPAIWGLLSLSYLQYGVVFLLDSFAVFLHFAPFLICSVLVKTYVNQCYALLTSAFC